MTVGNKYETGFSIHQGTLLRQPIFAGFIHRTEHVHIHQVALAALCHSLIGLLDAGGWWHSRAG